MTAPLSHLRILDLSRLYPGAYCTELLADLGADVLKIEAPGAGDMMRFINGVADDPAHVSLNRGKRSLQLDLKHARAPEVLGRLVAQADVVVESHRPGALDAAGLGFEAMRHHNPGLIWCSITGFGADGPLAEAPGHDITYLGYTGLLTRLAGNGPLPVPDVVFSVPLAGLMSAVAILAAVARRAHTGQGGRVDTSMADAALWLLSEDVVRATTGPPAGWGDMAARHHYRCADGRFVTVTASEPRSWALLTAALGLDDLAGYQMGSDEPTTIARLAEAFLAQSAAEWVEDPGYAGGVAPVNTGADILTDVHQVARRGIVPLGDQGIPVVANPVRIDGGDGAASSAGLRWPPALGEHTDEALRTAGFDDTAIADLRASGAFGR